jgi:hypothetical protein
MLGVQESPFTFRSGEITPCERLASRRGGNSGEDRAMFGSSANSARRTALNRIMALALFAGASSSSSGRRLGCPRRSPSGAGVSHIAPPKGVSRAVPKKNLSANRLRVPPR